MANPLNKKSNKERAEEENDIISIDEAAKETIDKISRDIGKSAAIKQLAIGSLSGWCTGFISIKVGKIAALAVGGSIVLLQIANHQGYIKINWDKVADKVEEKATGRSPKWMEKVERYVDRKVDKAEEELRRRERKARRWYHTFVNGEEPFQFKEIHIFVASFAAGLALGIISG